MIAAFRLLNLFLEAEHALQSAPGSVKPLRALVELQQELQVVGKVSLLVAVLFAILALELARRFVLDKAAADGAKRRVDIWLSDHS